MAPQRTILKRRQSMTMLLCIALLLPLVSHAQKEVANKRLIATLDTVFEYDQKYRLMVDSTERKYGPQSAKMNALWATIKKYDATNIKKVCGILDKYGWPSPDVVGEDGSSALFIVIQHADIKIQDKYLPVMRKAVKSNNASMAQLALLEDRVAIKHGRKQIYGSQITTDDSGSFLAPLEDPEHVDGRRAEAGLPPLAEYLRRFNMTWNPEAYKKQLPGIEKRQSNLEYK